LNQGSKATRPKSLRVKSEKSRWGPSHRQGTKGGKEEKIPKEEGCGHSGKGCGVSVNQFDVVDRSPFRISLKEFLRGTKKNWRTKGRGKKVETRNAAYGRGASP